MKKHNKKHVLVKFKRDWADEFTCEKFKIIKDSTICKEKENTSELIKEELYFGTNEYFEAGELSLDDFEFVEITTREYNLIEKLIGTKFGTGIV